VEILNGSIFEFVIVPFTGGTDPTAPPNNLPHLASVADVDALSMANANQYLIGYGVEQIPDTVAACHNLVKVHIGCKV